MENILRLYESNLETNIKKHNTWKQKAEELTEAEAPIEEIHAAQMQAQFHLGKMDAYEKIVSVLCHMC